MRYQPIISRATRQVLLPYSDKIHNLWPDLKTIEHNGRSYIIVPHSPRYHIALRAADIEMPAPILFNYDWNGGSPFETQKTTAALLTSNVRAYVLSDMGVGKTRAALWAWHFLHTTGCAKRLLVVAPLSTLKFAWLREITITLPHCKTVVLHGSKQKRLDLLKQDFDIAVVNHDGVRTIYPELCARTDIDTLILDELAVYRNPSQRSKQMREFAQRFTWCWGMTGRPMPQAPTDIWAQAKILTPQNVPRFFRHARSLLMVQVSPFKWVAKPDAIETAYSWAQPSVRFALDDVVELPEMISRVVDVELSPQQTTVYRKMSNEMAVLIDEKRITAANAGVALGKLLQIASGNVYTDNPLYIALGCEPRQQMLLELIAEAPEKVIVFAPFRHLIEETSKLLTKNDVKHAVIHGGTSGRDTILSDFQNNNGHDASQVLLAHPQTLHHGVTLTASSTVIWLSPPTSLEIFEQANARIRRISQRHRQQYFYLQSTSVERKIYAGLRNKQLLQDSFLEMIRTATEK